MRKKDIQISILIIICILLNFVGKAFADFFQLPLWMDSFGTVISAYVLGPICGAIVGLTCNIMYGMIDPISYIYGITNIFIGLIVGYSAQKGQFKSLFGTMLVSVGVTLASIVVSVPLNLYISGGTTGNIWGDGVIGFLQEQGIPAFLCDIIGEFYIDFLDKLLTLIVLYLMIKIRHVFRDKEDTRKHTSEVLRVLLIFSFIGYLSASYVTVSAETIQNTVDFNACVRTVYSSDNGLPCGEANDVVQTNDGVLWVGTYAGLYRYNGSEFRWMDKYESVRNVNCLYVDEEGRLWIGTNDNGLSICINEKVVNVVDETNGLESNSVRSIIKSSDGYYYIGTSGSVAVLQLNMGLQVLNSISEVNYTKSIAADHRGNVVAVTSAGELCFMREGKLQRTEKLSNDKEMFSCCMFDENGSLYVGTSENRIYVYDISDDKFQKISELTCGDLTVLNRLCFDENEILFVCADNGIGYFDKKGNYQDIKTGEFNNSIDNMVIDYQGNYWFTSSRMGLLRMAESTFTDVYGAIGLKSRVVNSVDVWKDQMYSGTDTGLDVVDIKSNRSVENKLTKELDGIRIRCIRSDSKGELWISTYGKGLYEVSEDGTITLYDSKTKDFGDWVRLTMELSDGTIVVSSDVGISYIQDHKIVRTIPYGDEWSNAMVLSIMDRGDGSILAGTDGDGLFLIENGQITRKFSTTDGLPSGVILRTVKDTAGVGTYIVTSNSLCYMDENLNVRELSNFPYYNNYDVLPDGKGNLFVMGSAGIYVVNEQELLSGIDSLQYDYLDARSGLTSALTVNAWHYCDENRNLYLSCDVGVCKVNLNGYSMGEKTYRMMISSVEQDSVSYEIDRGTPFVVSRDTEKIEIYPEVINYTIENPYVSYYLEGFDSSETVIPQSSLTSVVYTNLPSGNYTFHLSVLDSKSGEVLEKSSYEIVKEKAIYDNLWFRIYMLLIALIAVAWLTWVIVRTQIQRTLTFQRKELEFAREQVQMGNETILAIAKTVDAKDENTSQHSMRVSEYSVLIARELGFTEDECENLRKAALLHDIGKIGVPDRILNKPSRLTDEEYAIMKSHVQKGAEILKDFTLVEHVVDGAQFHHERYDGKGYMAGLKGEEIPLYGRIIGVADAFDAMTANRVYRKKLDFDYVLGELERGRGTQFDPQIVDIFLRLIEEKTIDVEKLYR